MDLLFLYYSLGINKAGPIIFLCSKSTCACLISSNLYFFAVAANCTKLIFFIGINHNYSVEKDFNLKVGEVKKFDNYQINFTLLEKEDRKNYKAIIGNFIIKSGVAA